MAGIIRRGLDRKRYKRAELTAGTGALVLGVGVGVLAAGAFRDWGIPILVLGLAMHGWGMFDKHRLESGQTGAPLWWETLIYWVCWLLLAAALLGAGVLLLG